MMNDLASEKPSPRKKIPLITKLELAKCMQYILNHENVHHDVVYIIIVR